MQRWGREAGRDLRGLLDQNGDAGLCPVAGGGGGFELRGRRAMREKGRPVAGGECACVAGGCPSGWAGRRQQCGSVRGLTVGCGAGVETPPGRAPGVGEQEELVWKAVLKTHPETF